MYIHTYILSEEEENRTYAKIVPAIIGGGAPVLAASHTYIPSGDVFIVALCFYIQITKTRMPVHPQEIAKGIV